MWNYFPSPSGKTVNCPRAIDYANEIESSYTRRRQEIQFKYYFEYTCYTYLPGAPIFSLILHCVTSTKAHKNWCIKKHSRRIFARLYIFLFYGTVSSMNQKAYFEKRRRDFNLIFWSPHFQLSHSGRNQSPRLVLIHYSVGDLNTRRKKILRETVVNINNFFIIGINRGIYFILFYFF